MADYFSDNYQAILGLPTIDSHGLGVGLTTAHENLKFRRAFVQDVETWEVNDYVRIFQVRPQERPISCKLYAPNGLAGTIDIGLMMSYEDGGGYPHASPGDTNNTSHKCYAEAFVWTGHHNGTELLREIRAESGSTISNFSGYHNRMPFWEMADAYSQYGSMPSGKRSSEGAWQHEIWDFVFRVNGDVSGSNQGAVHGLSPFFTVEMMYLSF